MSEFTGKKLKETCVKKGLSQDEAANLMNVAKRAISEMEAGKRSISADELAPGMIPEVAPEDEQMFVATVPDKIHGAGVIAYPNFMEDAAERMGGDFFVLPSSIHEVLLVKDNGQMTAKELENMVKEVNATQVEPADQLTDHVYHYDSQNHIFELADKYEERQREAEHEAVDKDSVLGDLKEKKQEIAKKDPAKDAATKAATKKHETSL